MKPMAMLTSWLRGFRAAPLPSVFCVLGLVLGCSLGCLALSSLEDTGPFVWRTAFSLFCFSVSLCSFADGLCRYREYRRFKRLFRRYGFRSRIAGQGAQSRCQRDAILIAASDTGHQHQARLFFRSLGYRWYHLLPDQIITNPWHFFRPEFLRSTFLPGKNVRCS